MFKSKCKTINFLNVFLFDRGRRRKKETSEVNLHKKKIVYNRFNIWMRHKRKYPFVCKSKSRFKILFFSEIKYLHLKECRRSFLLVNNARQIFEVGCLICECERNNWEEWKWIYLTLSKSEGLWFVRLGERSFIRWHFCIYKFYFNSRFRDVHFLFKTDSIMILF